MSYDANFLYNMSFFSFKQQFCLRFNEIFAVSYHAPFSLDVQSRLLSCVILCVIVTKN